MTQRQWKLRMDCSYEGANNKTTSLKVEQRHEDGSWKPLEISVQSPGFLIFVYSLLTCQHQYMHTNAAESGLILSGSHGTLDLCAGQDWMLIDLRVHFEAKLTSGSPTAEKISYIEGRMNQCPVSRNIHCSGEHASRVTFV
jgi:hypothetical protein